MNRTLGIAVGAALCVAAGLFAQTLSTNPDIATLETTADACGNGGKLQGTAEILTTEGPHGVVLLRFRVGMIEKWTVEKALVAVHLASAANPAANLAEEPPSQIMVSAVTAPWTEGSTQAPSFPPGKLAKTRKLQNNWLTFELPPEIAQQLASGAASSLAITVPEGRPLAVHSRRTGQFMPYLLVRGKRPVPGQL
jgi:hypothetical protein